MSNAFRGTLAEWYRPCTTPLLRMTSFHTVKEAAQLTGRSSSSIRRIIYPIIEDDKHPDRHHIEPSVAEVRALRIKGENFAWRISQEFLDRAVPPKLAGDAAQKPSTSGAGDEQPLRELVGLLRDQLTQSQQQLAVKDQQIATLSEITKSLNDRLREGNILIGTWQRQLPVPKGSEPPTEDADDGLIPRAKPTPRPASKAPVPKPSKSAKPTKLIEKKPAKKGFLARLFR